MAVAPNTVVAVGWQRTSENPVRTDAMIWQHLEGGGVWAQALKAPFTAGGFPDELNSYSEWARAVLYDSGTGLVSVVGDRELKVNARGRHTWAGCVGRRGPARAGIQRGDERPRPAARAADIERGPGVRLEAAGEVPRLPDRVLGARRPPR